MFRDSTELADIDLLLNHDTILILKNPTTTKNSLKILKIQIIKVQKTPQIHTNKYCGIDLGSSGRPCRFKSCHPHKKGVKF